MKKSVAFFLSLCLLGFSCTKEKTNYQAEIETIVPDHSEFKEVLRQRVARYDIVLEALNGTFYKGYNEVRARVINHETQEPADVAAVTFLPVKRLGGDRVDSAPHQYELEYSSEENNYRGYSVFTNETDESTTWDLYLSVRTADQEYRIHEEVIVDIQGNKNLNMTEFVGNDGEEYCMALVAPQLPNVAENELVAGLYKRTSPIQSTSDDRPDHLRNSFTAVTDYTLQLDPRMPEASMGNHSSPGNKDLVPHDDGLYYGLVNYTMTGNWTLNLMMLDANGRVIKGTVVPDDFTPGVEGVKSELHIDILF